MITLKKNYHISSFIKSHQKLLNVIFFALFIIYILTGGVFQGLKRIHTSDSIPINGDFQSYNFFRRVLDGQVPFRDFQPYLGLGVIILNVPLLAFSNNFTTSLFITHFTAYICFSLAITFITLLSSKNKYFAMLAGICTGIITNILIQVNQSLATKVNSFFPFISTQNPGNSLRIERAFLPFLLSLLLFITLKVKQFTLKQYITSQKSLLISGIIIGFFIFWSNDFGFACAISSVILLTILILFYFKDIIHIKLVFYHIFAIVLGFITGSILLSGFNMEAVFKSIIGISQYQFWYFGESGTKILQISNYLLNKQLMVYLIFFFLLIFYYLLKLIKNKIDIYGVLTMFVNLSTFLAFLIYSYGSGGWSYEALSLSITFTFFGLLFYFIESFIHRHGLGYIKKIGEIYISAILFMVFGLYWVKSGSLIIANNKIQRNAPYSENLGGYSSIAYDLDRAVNIIGNEQVFSTYAGALEIITGRYQPTGIDYIIYALGDNQREKYINNFLTNKYLYVTTIRNNHLAPWGEWELWIERANWFFYRYLYDFYKPVGFTSYNVIWKRMNNSERINANISVDVIQIDDSTYKIRFTSPSSENIIADLSINYVTKFDHSIDRLQTLHRLVTIEDIYMTTNSGKQYFYNIPESSENYNIGVWIKNGYGEITIKSKPTTCTRLLIKDITINDVLPTYNTLSASSMTDENWKNGINKKYNNIILFNFSEDYFKAINNAEYLYSDQKKAKIINVENKNNQWIWVTIDVDATSFAYPNIIELEDK